MLEILNPYSNLKILAHDDWLHRLKSSGFAKPITLNLYPTNLCNDHCIYCFFRGDKDIGGDPYVLYDPTKKREYISKNRLIELGHEIVQYEIKSVNITGGGEPTLADGFDEFSTILLDGGIDVGLTTNGVGLISSIDIIGKFKYLRVSLDTYNHETRKAIRGSYQGLLAIVTSFTDIATKSDCYVGLNFVITKHNIFEIEEFAKESKARGVRHVNYVIPRTRKVYNEINHEWALVLTLIEEAKKLESPVFTIRFSGFYEDEEPGMEKEFKFCWYNWTQLTITADGECYPCCITATQGRKNFGNIKRDSMADIIFSKERKEYIQNFSVDTCKICWYAEKNKLMNYWMAEKRMHENFV